MIAHSRLSDLRWLWTKVRRRIAHAHHDRRVRREMATSQASTQRAAAPALPWHPDATLPGASAVLTQWRAALRAERSRAEATLRHEVAVLAPHAACIDLDPVVPGTTIAGAGEIDEATRAAYRRIDWHRDFRSGHRWDPATLYLDVRVAPIPGADIKTPRELSRFQHIAPLAALPDDRGAVEFLLQVLDWMDANPVGRGVNWACTMDVALRAIGWIWGLRLFEAQLSGRYPQALARIAASLEAHGEHIENNLEYYEECTGNHYLSNVAGLVCIGAAFPGFAHADRWLLFGAQELVSEMDREVLADGGAHEASTHYHRLVAELFATSAALLERLPPARRARLARVDRGMHRVRPRLRSPDRIPLDLAHAGPMLPAAFHASLARMGEFTAALGKPNQRVPQFGDNDSARAHRLLDFDADTRDHRHLVALIARCAGREPLDGYGDSAALEARLIAGDLPITTHTSVDSSRTEPVLLAASGIAIARVPRA